MTKIYVDCWSGKSDYPGLQITKRKQESSIDFPYGILKI